MKSIKNLTRMTYETTAFQGWRLSLSRKGAAFTKCFSDRKYGDHWLTLRRTNSLPPGSGMATDT